MPEAAVKLTPNKDGEMPATELIAQAIIDIAEGMRRLESSRLSRKALLVLISHQSKVPQRDINIVLNNLLDLERDWLKPRAAK
jgi:hypothetical protein